MNWKMQGTIESMVIVNLIGGLGNQMFQYAFAYAFAKKNNQLVKLDINDFKTYNLRSYGLELFKIDIELASMTEVIELKYKKKKIWQKLNKKQSLSKQYYSEPYFHFDQCALSIKSDTYFQGYWQSENYFKDYRNVLLEQFTLQTIHPQTQKYQQKISTTNSVSIHIRRGDYISNEKANSMHGVCSINYYKNAILKIAKQIECPSFFIFSDDKNWVKDNLDFIKNKIVVELAEKVPDHEEMYLMSMCKHNIIANSSFSWWGAWLNKNTEKIVITPKKWFTDAQLNTKDLIPTSWIRLGDEVLH